MESITRRLPSISLASLLTVLLASAPVLLAGHEPPPRVSYLDGTAAYEPAGDVDWSEVTINLPLLNGDRIFSHQGSRLEVEFGYENFLRVSEDTDLVFSRIDGGEVELELRLGDMILRIDDPRRFKVRVPGAVIRIKKRGLYRISVDEAGAVLASVRKGRLEVENQARNRHLESGEELHISAPGSALNQISRVSYEDDFDLWSDRRDASHVSSRSVAYVGGSYAPGVYDLDRHGYWSHVSGHGNVWFPYVDTGWAPYRYGRWSRYPSWGWTWISYEPWGWLPYHYGSWYYYQPSSRWCWIPRFSASLWSPALVNFYFGGGYVGWAPRGFGRGSTYIDNSVTVINETNVVNVWRRPSRESGLTVVPAGDFRSGRTKGDFVETPSQNLVTNLRSGWPDELTAGGPGRGRSVAVVPNRSQAGSGGTPGETRVVTVGRSPGRGASGSAATTSWQSPRSGSGRATAAAPGSGSDSRVENPSTSRQVAPSNPRSPRQGAGTSWSDRGSGTRRPTAPAARRPAEARSVSPPESNWRAPSRRDNGSSARRPPSSPPRQVTPAKPPQNSNRSTNPSENTRRWTAPSRPSGSSARPPSSNRRSVTPQQRPTRPPSASSTNRWTSPRRSGSSNVRPAPSTRSRVTPSQRPATSSRGRSWTSPRRSSGASVRPSSSSRSRVAPRPSQPSVTRPSSRPPSRPSVTRTRPSRSSSVPARKPSKPPA